MLKRNCVNVVNWYSQARSQVLRFGGEQYIFRGAICLFYFMFKTNYFSNFQLLTRLHIASCLLIILVFSAINWAAYCQLSVY